MPRAEYIHLRGPTVGVRQMVYSGGEEATHRSGQADGTAGAP